MNISKIDHINRLPCVTSLFTNRKGLQLLISDERIKIKNISGSFAPLVNSVVPTIFVTPCKY